MRDKSVVGIDERGVAENHQGRVDLCTGLFFLAWAALGWYGLLGNATLLAAQRSWLAAGPALLPFVVLAVLTLGGFIILIKGGLALRRGWGAFSMDGARHGYAVALVLSLVALVATMQAVGFFLATLVFCCAWLLTLSRRIARDGFRVILMAVSCSLLIAGLVYFIFAELVKVPLP